MERSETGGKQAQLLRLLLLLVLHTKGRIDGSSINPYNSSPHVKIARKAVDWERIKVTPSTSLDQFKSSLVC